MSPRSVQASLRVIDTDCSSVDGQNGRGTPGGLCEACPHNEFGSADKGQGKACKESRLLFILRDQDRLPLLLVVPPTSIRPNHKFFMRLANKGLPYYGVRVKLGLEKSRSGEGIEYSMVSFNYLSKLTEKELAAVEAYSKLLRPKFERAAEDPEAATEAPAEAPAEQAEKKPAKAKAAATDSK